MKTSSLTPTDPALLMHYPGFVFRVLCDEGHTPEALLAGTGLSENALSDPTFRSDLPPIRQLILNAIEQSGDPHLGLSAPSLWYLARLELASGGVIGGTIPGMPLVLAGRSDRLGWASTTAYLDDQDLYVEQLNPADPGEYRTPEGWQPFETRDVLIEVADAPAERVTLRWTENGPVLPGEVHDLAAITPAGHVASLAWTMLQPDDRSLSAVLGIMRAGTVPAAWSARRRIWCWPTATASRCN